MAVFLASEYDELERMLFARFIKDCGTVLAEMCWVLNVECPDCGYEAICRELFTNDSAAKNFSFNVTKPEAAAYAMNCIAYFKASHSSQHWELVQSTDLFALDLKRLAKEVKARLFS